jgi:hypothetical protein
MATGIRRGPGIKARQISPSAGIESFKIDGSYASVAAFLAAKSASGENSSSAEAGDEFFHTGLACPMHYDGSEWQARDPNAKYTYVDFTRCGPIRGNLSTGAAQTSSAGDINVYQINGHTFQQYIDATLTEAYIPTVGTTGLEVTLDTTAAANDGVELYHDVAAAGRMAFKIGTSPAFSFKVKLLIGDVSDYDVVCVGFRKAAAAAAVASHAATGTTYSDLAALNVNAGDIFTVTRDDTGTATLTDTTDNWADGETKTLEVLVSAAGVVTFKIDGAAPTVTQAFTLDDTDYVIPFVHITRVGTTTGAEPVLVSWKCGLQ